LPGDSSAGYSLVDLSLNDHCVKGCSFREWPGNGWSSNENSSPDYSLNRYSLPGDSSAGYSFTKVTSGAERFFLTQLIWSREGKLLWSRVVCYLIKDIAKKLDPKEMGNPGENFSLHVRIGTVKTKTN